MIIVQVIVSILALWLLYHLMVWAIPLAVGVGLGYLAFQHGSGWLVAIGMGFFGTVVGLGILQFGMACRSPFIRVPIILAFVGPAVWAGSIAVHSIAIQTGAQGPIWPMVAGGFGGLVFGVLALVRLFGMTAGPTPMPAAQPVASRPPQGEPFPPPEPTVVYYHPIQPVRPRLADRRGDSDRIIDL